MIIQQWTNVGVKDISYQFVKHNKIDKSILYTKFVIRIIK